MCVGVDNLWLIFFFGGWKSLCLLDLDFCFLPQIGKFLAYYFFKHIFSRLFSLLFFWDPYNVDIITFGGVTEFPEFILNLHNFFSFTCSASLLLLACYLFHQVYFKFHLLYSLPLDFFLNYYYYYYFCFLFVKGLTDVFHSFLKSREYLYEYYFKFFIMYIIYICFAMLIVLFFHLNHILLSPYFALLSVSLC